MKKGKPISEQVKEQAVTSAWATLVRASTRSYFLSLNTDGERGAAGEAAAGVAGLLRDGRRRPGGHAEELPPPEPPPGHPDGGEVAGPLPPDPPLCLSVRWRGGGGRRRMSEGK